MNVSDIIIYIIKIMWRDFLKNSCELLHVLKASENSICREVCLDI